MAARSRFAWCITGSGHFLEESIALAARTTFCRKCQPGPGQGGRGHEIGMDRGADHERPVAIDQRAASPLPSEVQDSSANGDSQPFGVIERERAPRAALGEHAADAQPDDLQLRLTLADSDARLTLRHRASFAASGSTCQS